MPLGPGGLDSNGIWLYGEDDSEALASDLLNLGMQSVSDALGAGFGKILQVVSTTKTDTFSLSSTTFTEITGLTATITPTSTSSKIMVFVNVPFGMSTADWRHLRIMRGATPIGIGDAAGSRQRATSAQYFGANDPTAHISAESSSVLDSPNTTSATTYSVQVRPASGTVYVNRTGSDFDNASNARTVASITLMEVAG